MKKDMDFLRMLACRKEFLVEFDSMPQGSEKIAESLLRRGLIGVERTKMGRIINVMITRRGISKVLGDR